MSRAHKIDIPPVRVVDGSGTPYRVIGFAQEPVFRVVSERDGSTADVSAHHLRALAAEGVPERP